MSRLFEAWKPVSGARVTERNKMAWTVSGIDIFHQFPVIRINKFFETDFTIKVNVKKQRRFDRSTVIFKVEK